MSRLKRPPALLSVLDKALPKKGQPVAFIVAGHNGSGKSSLWYERLADVLEMPLVNADRLTLSILPEADRDTRKLAVWAQRLRDNDEHWQRLSQGAVRAFLELIRQERISFAFETVFSHLRRRPDGSYESKVSTLTELQQAGYFVVLLFVGLANVDLSIARVATRLQLGGHVSGCVKASLNGDVSVIEDVKSGNGPVTARCR